VEKVAPFLKYDNDEYAVPVPSLKKLFMMIDGYTVTDSYPYSDLYRGVDSTCYPANQSALKREGGFNYIRNSVKWVMDCYSGKLTGYIFEPDDPIIQTWARIYPTLFKPKDQMPQGLLDNIRYPEDMLYIQARMFCLYHMTDPQVFLNKEDPWDIAHEIYSSEQAGRTQEVLPYYLVTKLPGCSEVEFIQTIPVTPFTKEGQTKRNNLSAWIAGRCDPEHYGEVSVYLFSKQHTVPGPLLVENMIVENQQAKSDLTLWGDPKRGAVVIQGHMLVVPIGNTVMYVEPVYLQASAGTGFPRIMRIAAGNQNTVAWQPTFEEAIAELLGLQHGISTGGGQPVVFDKPTQGLIQDAASYWKQWLKLEAEGKFAEAGVAKQKLAAALETLFSASQVADSTKE
jgi:hypothetical protein